MNAELFWAIRRSPRNRTCHGNKSPRQEETGGEGQGADNARKTNGQTKAHSSCDHRKTYQHGRLSPRCQTEGVGKGARRQGAPSASPASDVDAKTPRDYQRT